MPSPVCVGPGRKPRKPVFSQRGSFQECAALDKIAAMTGGDKQLISVQYVVGRTSATTTANEIYLPNLEIYTDYKPSEEFYTYIKINRKSTPNDQHNADFYTNDRRHVYMYGHVFPDDSI